VCVLEHHSLSALDLGRFVASRSIAAISQEKTFHSAEGLEYIYVLNVLTRLEYNGERVLESGLEVLQNLMRVIKVVLVSIREPFARDLKALDEPCEIKEMLIQLVVINCFSIILNLATASLNWRERPEDSPQSRVQYDIASAKLVEIKREFLRLGILPILKGIQSQSIINPIQSPIIKPIIIASLTRCILDRLL